MWCLRVFAWILVAQLAVLPGAVAALTVRPDNTIRDLSFANRDADGPIYDLGDDTDYVWRAGFRSFDQPGMAIFRFTTPASARVTVSGGVAQLAGRILGGVTIGWDTGPRLHIPGGTSRIFDFVFRLDAGQTHTLLVDFGRPIGRSAVALNVATTPLPAGAWLMVTAIGGFGAMRWRRHRRAARTDARGIAPDKTTG